MQSKAVIRVNTDESENLYFLYVLWPFNGDGTAEKWGRLVVMV